MCRSFVRFGKGLFCYACIKCRPFGRTHQSEGRCCTCSSVYKGGQLAQGLKHLQRKQFEKVSVNFFNGGQASASSGSIFQARQPREMFLTAQQAICRNPLNK